MSGRSDERFTIPGPAGALEVWPTGGVDRAGSCGVICHPHPLHGGSMDNKVVFTLAKAMAEMGMTSVRFNFRGAGTSEGLHDEGRGEREDLVAVWDWLRSQSPGAEIWLAGFSFGSAVAYHSTGGLPGLTGLLLIAPPVNMSYFQPQRRISVPWGVVHGGQDQLIPEPGVRAWCGAHPDRPRYRMLAGADHFFHGQLKALRMTVRGLMEGGDA
ncbi:MAG: alpha/beta hydrolase [Gammaproteobacteria bacterium]|nr:alpha/beta hydrolase [Gammaproteobacteria bacterium]